MTKNPGFVGMAEMYRDETVTTLKANVIAANPVLVVFLNITRDFRRFLIEHEHTLAGLISETTSDLVQDKEEVYI